MKRFQSVCRNAHSKTNKSTGGAKKKKKTGRKNKTRRRKGKGKKEKDGRNNVKKNQQTECGRKKNSRKETTTRTSGVLKNTGGETAGLQKIGRGSRITVWRNQGGQREGTG